MPKVADNGVVEIAFAKDESSTLGGMTEIYIWRFVHGGKF